MTREKRKKIFLFELNSRKSSLHSLIYLIQADSIKMRTKIDIFDEDFYEMILLTTDQPPSEKSRHAIALKPNGEHSVWKKKVHVQRWKSII